MQMVEVFTDGACRGNPGPGGWGVLTRCDGVETCLSGGEAMTTNNRMELMAAIEGLRALQPGVRVTLTTDSQYVKQGITDWIYNWKKRDWRTSTNQPVKNVDLWQELDALSQQFQMEWCWVRGHIGHRENEIADRLARQAIDKQLRG